MGTTVRAGTVRTILKVPGQIAPSSPQTAGLISARVITNIGDDVSEVAARLGLDESQLAWGGDGALHAELDCPAGSWRVYGRLRIALWISLRPGFDPPPAPCSSRLPLATIVRNLRRRGVRFRDCRVLQGQQWSPPLGAAEALATMKASDPFGISAMWSYADRNPARVEVFDEGTLWANTPSDAEWWVMQAVADD